MASRPEHTKAGDVAVNIPESILDSADSVADALGLPEPGPAVKRVTPAYVMDALGVESVDEISDEMLRRLDEELGITFPPER